MNTEAFIEYPGGSVGILFNNRVLAEAQTRMGIGILAVANMFQTNELGISEVANLLLSGMIGYWRKYSRGGGKPPKIEDAFELMDNAGFVNVTESVMVAVSNVLTFDSREKAEGPEDTPLSGMG